MYPDLANCTALAKQFCASGFVESPHMSVKCLHTFGHTLYIYIYIICFIFVTFTFCLSLFHRMCAL